MKKILVIQTAFLGDVLLATAIIEKLTLFYPDAELHFMLRKGNENLLLTNPKVTKLWIWDKQNAKYKHWWQLLKSVRVQAFDLIVNLQRYWSTALFTLLARAKYTLGFRTTLLSLAYDRSVKFVKKNRHELQRNQDLIIHLTDENFCYPKLYPNLADKQKAEKIATLPRPYITISPVSLWPTKTYPIAKWAEFLKQISRKMSVYFLGSLADAPIAEQIILASENNNLQMKNCCGELALIPSGVLMQGAQMNYTLDSAATHLATAMQAPVSSLFLSTSPIFGFAPAGKHAYVVESNAKLPCKPCTNHGRKSCPKGHFRCAYTLNSSLLLDKLPAEYE